MTGLESSGLYEHPFIFQQDNAHVHTAGGVQRWLEYHDVNTIKWPAQSPDLNIIEHLWDDIGRAILRKLHDERWSDTMYFEKLGQYHA